MPNKLAWIVHNSTSALIRTNNNAKIDHTLNQAYRLGLPGTPSFVVNDQKLAGPPTYATLKGIIDEMLAAQ